MFIATYHDQQGNPTQERVDATTAVALAFTCKATIFHEDTKHYDHHGRRVFLTPSAPRPCSTRNRAEDSGLDNTYIDASRIDANT